MVDAVGGRFTGFSFLDQERDDRAEVIGPGGRAALVVHDLVRVEFLHAPEHGEYEIVAMSAVEPGGADDPGFGVRRERSDFAVALREPVHARRIGRIVLPVRPISVAVEHVIGRNMNEARADLFRASGDIRNTVGV